MTAFREVRFPDTISRGARGGPRRKTRIVEMASGFEERNAAWSNSRRYYDVSFGIRRADDLTTVVAFFEAMNGRLYGFRFKDWSDYKSSLPSAALAATDQVLGEGDGATFAFQLRKAYVAGAETWHRAIRKPVAGTVLVALDGVAQGSGWTLDATTGIVTFDTPPALGVEVTAGFQFDVPARFDTDDLPVNLDLERSGSIPSIPLAEIRV